MVSCGMREVHLKSGHLALESGIVLSDESLGSS